MQKSKYHQNTPPTASSFGEWLHTLKTTSKVIGNLSGEYNHFPGAHSHASDAANFCRPKGSGKKDPKEYTKKAHWTSKLAAQQTFKIDRSERRPSVPKEDEKPIMGFKSGKNFLHF